MLDREPVVDPPRSRKHLLRLGIISPVLRCCSCNVMSVTILCLNRSTAVISGRPIHDCKIWNMASLPPSSTGKAHRSMQSAI